MPMPSMTDLQTMYGAWNPQAYLQAQDNSNLEQQIRQQQFQQEAEDTKTKGLNNLFQSQNDPMKLEHQGLVNSGLKSTNEGVGYDTQIKGVAARRAAANEWDNLDQDAKDHLLKGTKADHDILQAQAQNMMLSLDPAVQAQGQRIYGLSQHARDRAEKWQDAADLKGYEHEKKMDEIRLAGENAANVAGIGAQSRLAVKQAGAKGASSIEDQIRSGKLTYERAAAMYTGAASLEEDPDKKALYEALAGKYEQANLNQKNAASGNKADLQGMGVPATQAPAAVLGSPPAQAPVANVPQGAVQMLRQNPNLATAFDAKYGKGAAAKALGK